MIDFHYAPTPNGWKVAIMLEECGLEYTTHLIRLSDGDQFKPEFLAISPNAKMPAIVDHDPGDGWDGPVPVFESGAIMLYLADRTGQFAPKADDRRGRKELMEWLFWQVGNQGPMGGQLSHFQNYAPEDDKDYGFKRYLGEYDRNLGVLENRLEQGDWLVGGAYSIADMLAFPWVFIAKPLGASLDEFPRVADWRARIKARPAVQRAIDLHKANQNRGQHRVDNNKVLFSQTSASLRPGKG
ncbi:glutathione S-transferase family protein [Chachezhania antarctica]|uniref:glutathione S-transferase family protein n=1 Tax=Chachezhania antarctica TaxID=2340860 RepID=UPI000EB16ED7|nr:glutathione binding-like protein [Chachezhania antarctica]|tara:strand:+ start:5633 stop:6355 length:723 start_codon:yes stop_codon:yes gene_type:complete